MKQKTIIILDLMFIILLITSYHISFTLAGDDDEKTKEEQKAEDEEKRIDAAEFIFTIMIFIMFVILAVILVEVLRSAFTRKVWWVSLHGTTKLVSLGQFATQIKLGNNFYQLNFNKMNEADRRPKNKDEEDEKEDRGYVELEQEETPTTVYSYHPTDFIFDRDGGIIWQYHRICHLFKLTEIELPEYMEFYEKKIKKNLGSKIRYGLYKFPVQFIPGIRSAWFKWILKKMEKGERLKKVPMLIYTLFEEKYYNIYEFRFREILDLKENIFLKKYGKVIEMTDSGALMENIRSSSNSRFLCKECKTCEIMKESLISVNLPKYFLDSNPAKEIPEKDLRDIEQLLIKVYFEIKYNIKDLNIDTEDKKMISKLEKFKEYKIHNKIKLILKLFCKKYDRDYKIKFIKTQVKTPIDEKEAVANNEAREQLIATHIRTQFEFSNKLKQASKDFLDLKHENLILYAELEKLTANKLGEMKDQMPTVIDLLQPVLNIMSLGIDDASSLAQYFNKEHNKKISDAKFLEDQSQAPNDNTQEDKLQLENNILKQVVKKFTTAEEFNILEQKMSTILKGEQGVRSIDGY